MRPAQSGDEVRVSATSAPDRTSRRSCTACGVPSTDIGSGGPYGVYHSAFDNFAWFVMNADPHFVYLQQMARVLGLEALRMADTDVLPYDYVAYAREDDAYIEAAKRKASRRRAHRSSTSGRPGCASTFATAADHAHRLQFNPPGRSRSVQLTLRTG